MICKCGCGNEVKKNNIYIHGHNPTKSRGFKFVNKDNWSSEKQRERRLNQLKIEENMANKMRSEGWEIFSPTVVCDRIGIKDQKISFIEFKKKGQKLRKSQQKVLDLMKDNYVIIYS